jgi:hypothetical protein
MGTLSFMSLAWKMLRCQFKFELTQVELTENQSEIMRYWWVNQNQTYRHEVQDGYLWSPKCNINGVQNSFAISLRTINPISSPSPTGVVEQPRIAARPRQALLHQNDADLFRHRNKWGAA